MKRVQVLIIVTLSILMFVGIPAQAALFSVDFTVSGFTNNGPSSPPTDPVSGNIVFDALSATSTIDSLLSIDLIIDSHTYTLGEIGYISPFGLSNLIGGTLLGIEQVGNGTNDFFLLWTRDMSSANSQLFFAYASENVPDTGWLVTDKSLFSKFSVSPVPEASTMLLLGSGLIGLVGYGRRRMKK